MFNLFSLFNLFKRNKRPAILEDNRVAVFTYNNKRIVGLKVHKGYVLIHKNGNKSDFNPDNLEILTRAQLLKRNQQK